jgi:Fe-S cluster biogenesis protein NfuA
VNTALDAVRPFLQSHGGGVTVLGISDKIAHLQLWGSCHGCSASLITLKTVIEKALHEQVPELERIEVAGLTPTPADDARKWLPLLHRFELQKLTGRILKVLLLARGLVCRGTNTYLPKIVALRARPHGHGNEERMLYVWCHGIASTYAADGTRKMPACGWR